jgi:hypothetical protein
MTTAPTGDASRRMALTRRLARPWSAGAVPGGPVEPIHVAVIVAEHTPFDALKAEPNIEAVGALVCDQGVEQHGRYRGLSEATRRRQPHYRGALAAAKVGLLTDPNVDRALVRRDFAPVTRFFQRRIDGLKCGDGTAITLRDQQLPQGTLRLSSVSQLRSPSDPVAAST